jgi:hypothetical protein
MPLCDMLLRPDLLVGMLDSVSLDARLLCGIASVNRQCRDFLRTSPGDGYWVKMADNVTGDDSWQSIRPGLPNLEHNIYSSMLTVCPWLSAPQRIPVRYLGDELLYSLIGDAGVNLVGARWQMHCSDGDEGVEDCIVVEAKVNSTLRVFTVPMRPQDQPDFVQRVYDEMPEDTCGDTGRFSKNDRRADALMDQALLQVRPHYVDTLFGRMHDSVDIVAQVDHFTPSSSGILFLSKTGRLLRRIMTNSVCSPPVLYRPAEFWVLDANRCGIYYYGPRDCMSRVTEKVVWPSFVLASRGRAEEALAYLASRGVSPSDVRFHDRMTLLMASINLDHTDDAQVETIVRATLPAIDTRDEFGKTALTHAVHRSKPRVINLLLENGATITRSAFHASVFEAARIGPMNSETCEVKMGIFKQMLSRYGQVDMQSDENLRNTALMIAARSGSVDVVSHLLKNGADATLTDCVGRTAMDIFKMTTNSRGYWYSSSAAVRVRRMLGAAMRKQIAKKRRGIFLFLFPFTPLLLIFFTAAMSEPRLVSPPSRETVETELRKKLESKKRHSKQNKAMLLLTKSEMKKLADENRKLREEVVSLRLELERFQPRREVRHPVTTKHAIFAAGLYNVHHNDVLKFAPLLVLAYETETGRLAIRREGMTVCFPAEDRELVASMVERLAPIYLPEYWAKRNK